MNIKSLLFILSLLVLQSFLYAKELPATSLAENISPPIPIVDDPEVSLLPRVPAPENVNLFADPEKNYDLLTYYTIQCSNFY